MGPAVAVYHRMVGVSSHATSAQQVRHSFSGPGLAATRSLEDASHLRGGVLDQLPVVLMKSEPDVRNGNGSIEMLADGASRWRSLVLADSLRKFGECLVSGMHHEVFADAAG